MSCCGQTAQQAQAAAYRTLDARTAALTHVRLVYLGEDRRTQPFVAAGKVYQFGNNERRRTNVVAAAAVQKLMATGLFEVFDPERHNEDGTPKVDKETGRQGEGETAVDPNLANEQTAVSLSSSAQTGSDAGQGEITPPVTPSPASASPLRPEPLLEQAASTDEGLRAKAAQPAATVRTKPSASKK